jgi:hypothetical protein
MIDVVQRIGVEEDYIGEFSFSIVNRLPKPFGNKNEASQAGTPSSRTRKCGRRYTPAPHRRRFNKLMTETTTPPKIKFYTTGFAGKEINDLKSLLDALDAVLVDVRFSPTSEMMRWRQIYLKTLLREKYHHVPPLGNRTFREGRIQIQNLDLGIKILVSFQTNAVLMCECAEQNECHRLVIARELRRRGFETEELGNWKLA